MPCVYLRMHLLYIDITDARSSAAKRSKCLLKMRCVARQFGPFFCGSNCSTAFPLIGHSCSEQNSSADVVTTCKYMIVGDRKVWLSDIQPAHSCSLGAVLRLIASSDFRYNLKFVIYSCSHSVCSADIARVVPFCQG